MLQRGSKSAISIWRQARVSPDDVVAETVTCGVLEMRPRRGLGGWELRVSIDETAGEHPANEEDAKEGAEELTLEAFEEEFLQPEDRLADTTVSVDDPQAKVRFNRWLSRMLSRLYPQAQREPVHRSRKRAA